MEKTYLAVSSWVDFFVILLVDRKAVDSTPKYSLACLRYKPAFYFLSLHKIQMSKQHS